MAAGGLQTVRGQKKGDNKIKIKMEKINNKRKKRKGQIKNGSIYLLGVFLFIIHSDICS